MTSLLGIHDIEGASATPAATWLLDTVALSENPPAKAYGSVAPGLEIIARLNWGYGSTGTLPPADQYVRYLDAVDAYIMASSGCRRWIIGNEPNLPREWPDGQPILPSSYASCYSHAHDLIHDLAGHADDEVLLAGSGPWNAEYYYPGNERVYEGKKYGDWVKYTLDCLTLIGSGCDGLALHAYTHGYDPALASSTQRMNAPFSDRYYHFRTYQDYLNALPSSFTGQLYITEANGDSSWLATGLIDAMAQEITAWNQSHAQRQINCLICYRFPKYDQFYMQGKQDVLAEYVSVANRYASSTPPPQPEPPVPDGGSGSRYPDKSPYLQSWDKRLDVRGVWLGVVEAAPDLQWHVTDGRWFNEDESQGRHHVFLKVLDANGALAMGVSVRFGWSSGSQVKKTEKKHDDWLGQGAAGDYSLDFDMYEPAPSYWLKIDDGQPSDELQGLGLGSIEQPHYKIHTSYAFAVQLLPTQTPPQPEPVPAHPEWVVAPAGANLRTEPVTGTILTVIQYSEQVAVFGQQMGSDGYPWKQTTYQRQDGWVRGDLLSTEEPQPAPESELLLDPLPGSVVTQHFYQNPDDYYRFNLPGHDGVDLAGVPVNTPVRCLCRGTVVACGMHDDYGNFVRVQHDSLLACSFYAHLSEISVTLGQSLSAGERIGLMGATGNATGPHLHLEVRSLTPDGQYNPHAPMPQGRIDPESFCALYNLSIGRGVLR